MTSPPTLIFDEIDDILYFSRANEPQDLQQTLTELSQKYNTTPKTILESAIDPETGNTVLHHCSANGLSDLLPTLLSKLQTPQEPSPLINHPNKQSNTPLHWAAYNGHLSVVKLLVAAGADMWIKNSAGHLAMFEAERADKSEVVQFLLEAGGKEVEKPGEEGRPSAEDVVEAQEGEAGSSAQANGGADVEVDMEGAVETNG